MGWSPATRTHGGVHARSSAAGQKREKSVAVVNTASFKRGGACVLAGESSASRGGSGCWCGCGGFGGMAAAMAEASGRLERSLARRRRGWRGTGGGRRAAQVAGLAGRWWDPAGAARGSRASVSRGAGRPLGLLCVINFFLPFLMLTRMLTCQNQSKQSKHQSRVVICSVLKVEGCKSDGFIVQGYVLDFGGSSRL